jgi:hypothetical protein
MRFCLMSRKKVPARSVSEAAEEVVRAAVSPLSANKRVQLLLFLLAETIRENYDEGEHEMLAIRAKHELLGWLLP